MFKTMAQDVMEVIAGWEPVEWTREQWEQIRPVAHSLFLRFVEEEDGAGMTEYVMILFLIAVVSVVASRFLGMMAADSMSNAANVLAPGGANVGGS